MSRFSAAEAKPFFYALLTFFGSKCAHFDNIDIHGIRVSCLGGSREGLVGLVSGFGVPFGDFVGVFPLGLVGDGLLIPVVDGGWDSVHRHDLVHEGRGDASGEISH